VTIAVAYSSFRIYSSIVRYNRARIQNSPQAQPDRCVSCGSR
jgi:hypothetical protein